jgi:hypothetical protein
VYRTQLKTPHQLEQQPRPFAPSCDELVIPLPSAAVADEVLARASDLGYAHRDLASLHEVLAETPAGYHRLSEGTTQ